MFGDFLLESLRDAGVDTTAIVAHRRGAHRAGLRRNWMRTANAASASIDRLPRICCSATRISTRALFDADGRLPRVLQQPHRSRHRAGHVAGNARAHARRARWSAWISTCARRCGRRMRIRDRACGTPDGSGRGEARPQRTGLPRADHARRRRLRSCSASWKAMRGCWSSPMAPPPCSGTRAMLAAKCRRSACARWTPRRRAMRSSAACCSVSAQLGIDGARFPHFVSRHGGHRRCVAIRRGRRRAGGDAPGRVRRDADARASHSTAVERQDTADHALISVRPNSCARTSRDTMAFYHPRCIDPAGGFFHYFKDDGTVYDRSHRHLVSSTRFVFNYAMAAREFGEDARCGRNISMPSDMACAYLRDVHRNPRTRRLCLDAPRRPCRRSRPTTATASPSCCWPTRLRARRASPKPRGWMDETWALLESRFWDAGARPVPRRSRRRLALQRLPRPERQHAHVRGDAGRVRGERRSALSRSRGSRWPTT